MIESIFGDEFHILKDSHSKDEIRFSVDMKVQLATELTLKVSISESRFETFPIRFVPPIKLQIEFPSDYPLTSQPLFTIECNWFHSPYLSPVCQHLHELWLTQSNQPIICTLSEIGFNHRLLICW